jgi:hypothetical protein
MEMAVAEICMESADCITVDLGDQGPQLPQSPQHINTNSSEEVQWRNVESVQNPEYQEAANTSTGDVTGVLLQGSGVRERAARSVGRPDLHYRHPDAYGVSDSVVHDTRHIPVAESGYAGNVSGPKYRKPATYDGTTEWQDYLIYFEMLAELNEWDARSKALELAISLRGIAQSVLSDLGTEHRMSYRHLVSALQSRFEPTNQSELYRTQVKNRTRKTGESVTELSQDIKRLVRLAYPEAPSVVRDHLVRDCFIDSLNDSVLQWAVFQGKAVNVEDAVRIALEYEAFQAGHRGGTGGLGSIRMQSDIAVDDNSSGEDELGRGLPAEVLARLDKL